MEEHWRAKERQVLRCYTQYLANLGAYSTQRNEGHHVAVKQFLNPQITLEQATLPLVEHLRFATFRLDTEEAESRTKVPRFLDISIFKHLIGHVTIFSINQIKVEWEEAKNIEENDLEGCICTIIHQFGIPCRHRLAFICLSSTNAMPIPINLLHPRWKIDEDPIFTSAISWIMPPSIAIYNEDPALPHLPRLLQHDRYYHKYNGQNLLLKSLQDVE